MDSLLDVCQDHFWAFRLSESLIEDIWGMQFRLE